MSTTAKVLIGIGAVIGVYVVWSAYNKSMSTQSQIPLPSIANTPQNAGPSITYYRAEENVATSTRRAV